MNPYSFIKRNSGVVVPLVLVFLGLAMGMARPASGLKDYKLDGTKTIEPAKVGAETQAPEDPPAKASFANVTPEVFYYHQDATGNLAAMTDDGGQVVWQVDLRPFGQGSPTSTNHPLRFAGQPQETDIGGLYHLGARVYDPVTGRFQSPDPILLGSIKRNVPQRFNQYSYGLNNPYRYHDASGLDPSEGYGSGTDARNALAGFLHFFEAKLGPNPSRTERAAAFSYGYTLLTTLPNAIDSTNNRSIRNRAGQMVDLEWGARFAGLYVAEALLIDGPLLASSSPDEIAKSAKKFAAASYFVLKHGWNAIDEVWTGGALTGSYRPDDPNFRGIELLIDYIVYGSDLRDYFDPTQLPQRPESEKNK